MAKNGIPSEIPRWPPVETPLTCRQYKDKRVWPEGFHKWTENLCPQIIAGVAPIPVEHIQHSDVHAGDWYPCTLHGARARNQLPRNDEDPCIRHYGRTYIKPDGDIGIAFCSRARGDPEVSYAYPFIADQRWQDAVAKTQGLVKPEDWAFVGSLAAPDWTEVFLFSHLRECLGVPF